MTGARAIGVPGCPDSAFCTASIDKVRMVSMQSLSIEAVFGFNISSAAVMTSCLA
jgi:hypothetical protein